METLRVRVIVVNYDGADVTLRCLAALTSQTYPSDALEIVLVDNASVDGLLWRVRSDFPHVKIIENLTNEGFARGNNAAMRHLGEVDVVALINNDAIPHSNWLSELIVVLRSDPKIGAVTSKMIFNRQAVGLQLESQSSPVQLLSTSLNGIDVNETIVFDERWSEQLPSRSSASSNSGRPTRWCRSRASFSLEIQPRNGPQTLSLMLKSSEPTVVLLRGTDFLYSVDLTPVAKEVELSINPGVCVINNAGGGIFSGFHGGDIGFKEVDVGQFDSERDVFSFCGGAVAMKQSFLQDVGLFDPSFFLYYEDLDLSWRAHFKGWRIRYVPQAIVRHEHAYSSGEWSPFFRFWVDRNRRLTLIKNAPARVAAKAFLGALVWGLRDSLLPVTKACIRFHKPPLRASSHRLRQLASFLKAAPSAYLFRRQQLRNSDVDPDFVYEWISTRFEAESLRSRETGC